MASFLTGIGGHLGAKASDPVAPIDSDMGDQTDDLSILRIRVRVEKFERIRVNEFSSIVRIIELSQSFSVLESGH